MLVWIDFLISAMSMPSWSKNALSSAASTALRRLIEIREYGTQRCTRFTGLPAARRLPLAQLHERRRLRIGRGERPHVGQREIDVGQHAERDGAERQPRCAAIARRRRSRFIRLTTILMRAPTRGAASGADDSSPRASTA